MTGPILYDPIAFPLLPNLADGVDAFGDVSTVAGGNFAKLNARLRGNPARWTTFADKQNKATTFTGYSDWTTVIDWPSTNIHLPGKVAFAVLVLRGQVGSGLVGSYPQASLTVDVTGTGVSKPIPARDNLVISCLWGYLGGARQWFFAPGDLIGGGDVMITPMVSYNDVQSGSVAAGEWSLSVFSGEPT